MRRVSNFVNGYKKVKTFLFTIAFGIKLLYPNIIFMQINPI